MSRIIAGAGTFCALFLVLVIEVWAGNMPLLNVSIASGMALMIGTYLGLDLMAAVTKTLDLPKGDFQKIKVFKYIYSLVLIVIVMLVISIISYICEDGNDGALAILSGVIFLIFSYRIAGRKANSVAQDKGPAE